VANDTRIRLVALFDNEEIGRYDAMLAADH
jgi:aspartyl aminopeptidase